MTTVKPQVSGDWWCRNFCPLIRSAESWMIWIHVVFVNLYSLKNMLMNIFKLQGSYSANSYLLKVNNKITRKMCEIFSKLIIKILDLGQWCRSRVFIVNFERISHLFLIVDFEQVTFCWVGSRQDILDMF